MPVALPLGEAFNRLRKADPTILTTDDALLRQRRAMHVGIVNGMPDAVMKDTVMHFFLPLHHASGSTIIIPHQIRLEGLDRGEEAQQYEQDNAISLEYAQETGLDALFVTGSNIPNMPLKDTKFYPQMEKIINWAESAEGPTSTIYSCLASHAYMQIKHEIPRQLLSAKQWGVFEHRVKNENHPLTIGMDTVFDIPHSRWNGISEDKFIDAGMSVLVSSEDAGVHMATSRDGLRSILWQGHPEYRTNSLMKEWKRDFGNAIVARLKGERVESLPPFPENYFRGKSKDLIETFREKVLLGHFDDQIKKSGKLYMPEETERQIEANIPNRWSSSRRAMLGNWLAAIMDKTNFDRKKPFMEGVDPDDVFGLNRHEP